MALEATSGDVNDSSDQRTRSKCGGKELEFEVARIVGRSVSRSFLGRELRGLIAEGHGRAERARE